jgi:hypothetical protein
MHGKTMLARLLVPLLLLALLLGAAAARATPAAPAAVPVAVEEPESEEGEEEGGEGESAEEECEEATEEFEEAEISREELDEACERQRKRYEPGPGGTPPEVCIVRTFDSSATADADKGILDLAIRYTTFEPAAATISVEPNIGTVRRHLGVRGTIRLHEHVAAGPMKKLAVTHKLSVKVDIPSTPALCQRYYSNSTNLRLR